MLNNEQQIIERCQNNDSQAQFELYKHFSTKMYAICLRYVKHREEAGDILQESFIKAFEKLNEFKFNGSFEGWLKRLVINTAINYYHTTNRHFMEDIADINIDNYENMNETITSDISHKELLKTIQELPEGYRFVFNLYVLEGYSHKEIGEILDITENTSKSQLSRARKILQDKIMNLKKINYENAR
ncbi:MAG: hypothetical protein A2X12_04510 [Bacteroidetes bacterium GWE2_29_8]|nr:MAG: hypothetical protein A2X12_04510 [Bacteroidetes bacterium GWE2_29_8]OFY14436.1 MAG: hypothetical protein A2X02_01400 [Bacteroidetes bacterium GWF2_29_10]